MISLRPDDEVQFSTSGFLIEGTIHHYCLGPEDLRVPAGSVAVIVRQKRRLRVLNPDNAEILQFRCSECARMFPTYASMIPHRRGRNNACRGAEWSVVQVIEEDVEEESA